MTTYFWEYKKDGGMTTILCPIPELSTSPNPISKKFVMKHIAKYGYKRYVTISKCFPDPQELHILEGKPEDKPYRYVLIPSGDYEDRDLVFIPNLPDLLAFYEVIARVQGISFSFF